MPHLLFAVCFLPFAFQKDLMFAVGLRPFEKQRAKRKQQKARKARRFLMPEVAFCRLLFAFCFSKRGGIFERQPEKAKNSLINSKFFVIINVGFDPAVFGMRLGCKRSKT
ncbi:hypothetical protein L0337_32120 [candidate division KSB1 bacterium]|nr:hypothetical protein [candidate division KSB1 bacterium]